MIIQNVTVLSGDKILINQDLFIKEGKIVKVSKHDPETQDSERIAFGDRRILAIPALVNAHTHTGMAFFAGSGG